MSTPSSLALDYRCLTRGRDWAGWGDGEGVAVLLWCRYAIPIQDDGQAPS